MDNLVQYVAFLRGINVGGHHKVPMADLRQRMAMLGFTEITTLLNSGNIIFSTVEGKISQLEKRIAHDLEQHFEFPVPVLVRRAEEIEELITAQPFSEVEVTKDTRLYVSFLKEDRPHDLSLPWTSEDRSFRILQIHNRIICSVLDLSVTKTPKGMDALEQLFGKNITTRNWNTLLRIAKKLEK